MFSYPLRTALAVGLSMAQIGEFAFVLLSVASHQGLLAYQVYMLLMGAPPYGCPLAQRAASRPLARSAAPRTAALPHPAHRHADPDAGPTPGVRAWWPALKRVGECDTAVQAKVEALAAPLYGARARIAPSDAGAGPDAP